jgi:hypothetical protein
MGHEMLIPKLGVQKQKQVPLKCITFIANLCFNRPEWLSKADPSTSIQQACQWVKHMDTSDVHDFFCNATRLTFERYQQGASQFYWSFKPPRD